MISITPLSEPLAEDAVQPVADGRADGQRCGLFLAADARGVHSADRIISGHIGGGRVDKLAVGHRLGPPAPAGALMALREAVNRLAVDGDGLNILGGLDRQLGRLALADIAREPAQQHSPDLHRSERPTLRWRSDSS